MLFNVIIVLFSFNTILCIDNKVDVKTSSGLVRGQTLNVFNHTVDQFLSIPFAEPPVGALRFAKPQPIDKPREGIIDATVMKDSCIQPTKGSVAEAMGGMGKITVSEDCLYLNIWTSKSGANSTALKPVMFWIYGGTLKVGSIFQIPPYNGSVLATHDVVVVAVNYRLGPFGFFYGGTKEAPGNQGLYDQLLGLKWVRENIHLFGGDKNQITIFGESAGSWSTSSHILSPLSRGLYKRAIMESGAQLWNKEKSIFTTTDALNYAKSMAKNFKCDENSDNWLQCLQKVSAKDIDDFGLVSLYFPLEGTDFLPITAQKAFETDNYNTEIDIMAGVNKNEGALLVKIVKILIDKDIDIGHEYIFDLLVTVANVILHGVDNKKVNEFYLKNVDKSSSSELTNAFNEFFGDVVIKCPTFEFAKHFTKQNPKNNVYFYELTYSSKIMTAMNCNPETMGVCHGADLIFVFGLPYMFQGLFKNQTDLDFSEDVMRMWSNFAKTGIPDKDWPKFMSGSDFMVKELNPMKKNIVLQNPFKSECEEFWGNYWF